MRMFLIALAVAVPAAAPAQLMQPGQWEITSTITSIKGNLPPSVMASMKGRPNVIRQCITPAQAAQGPRDIMKARPDCKFDKFTMSGGKYASQMQCKDMRVSATGNYTPVSMAATATMVMTGQMALTMTSNTKGRRIGACK